MLREIKRLQKKDGSINNIKAKHIITYFNLKKYKIFIRRLKTKVLDNILNIMCQ